MKAVSLYGVIFLLIGFIFFDKIFVSSTETASQTSSVQKTVDTSPIPDSLLNIIEVANWEGMEIFGIPVPLQEPYLAEEIQTEMIKLVYGQPVKLIMCYLRLGRYGKMLDDSISAHQLPYDWKYLTYTESVLNPQAISPAGAVGIQQFMASTAKDMGIKRLGLVDDRRDPAEAIHAACLWLERYGPGFANKLHLQMSYNAGPGQIKKRIKSYGTKDPFALWVQPDTRKHMIWSICFKVIDKNWDVVLDRTIRGIKQYKPVTSQRIVVVVPQTQGVDELAAVYGLNPYDFLWRNPAFSKVIPKGRYEVNVPSDYQVNMALK